MVESMLRSAGYTTGLFTSPHLCDVRERVRINGQVPHVARINGEAVRISGEAVNAGTQTAAAESKPYI